MGQSWRGALALPGSRREARWVLGVQGERVKEREEKEEPGAGVGIWLASNLCSCPGVKEELISLLREKTKSHLLAVNSLSQRGKLH